MTVSFTLPHPDEFADTLVRHYHAEFMHAFYALKNKDVSLRFLLAIEDTAAKTRSTAEVVARALVECGLRAPKNCLPEKFIQALEKAAKNSDIRGARLSTAQKELLQSWQPPRFTSRFRPLAAFAAMQYSPSFSVR